MSTGTPALVRRVDGMTFGRPTHWYVRADTGERIDGVTTILKGFMPTPALIRWASNTTAEAAVDRWDELSAMGVSERLKTLKGAAWDKRDAAALRGTELHGHAERLAHGHEVEVSDEQLPLVESAARFLDDWRVEPLIVEATVYQLAHGWSGTLDLVARLRDGRVWLLDYKSGSGVYPDHALQLAAYANAEAWVDGEGAAQPLPRIDAGGVVHVRSDGYDLIPVDIGPDVYRVFRHGCMVARFNATQDKAREGKAPGVIGAPIYLGETA